MLLTLLFTTFVTVFLAEMGDKTQLTTITLSSTTNKPLAVFIGSSLALILATLLGALAGGSIANLIPAFLLKLISGIVFLIIGINLPSDDLISVILAKNFSDKQIKVEKKHIDYIIKMIDRSYEKISQFILTLDKYSLKKGTPFNLKLIKEVLKMI